jgi:hypothetical protein
MEKYKSIGNELVVATFTKKNIESEFACLVELISKEILSIDNHEIIVAINGSLEKLVEAYQGKDYVDLRDIIIYQLAPLFEKRSDSYVQ